MSKKNELEFLKDLRALLSKYHAELEIFQEVFDGYLNEVSIEALLDGMPVNIKTCYRTSIYTVDADDIDALIGRKENDND